MYANMLCSLIEHGRIKSTDRKIRDLRRIAERTITKATRLGDLLKQDADAMTSDQRARIVHAMRDVRKTVKSRDAVSRLFNHVAPKCLGRPGGYTRSFKLGNRKGDNAPMRLLELVDLAE